MKIGFFDSGSGGKYIQDAVEEYMPLYEYSYFGDYQNLPYGNKSEEEIYELTKIGVKHLFDNDCILVIIACNTASSETLRKLQDTFLISEYPDRKILGVIIPTIEVMIERGDHKALLIATKRTIESNKYKIELQKKMVNGIVLDTMATPELVHMIEDNNIGEAMDYLSPIIDAFIEKGGEGIILGCTHYCVLKDMIRTKYPNFDVFSQDEIIPEKLEMYLAMHPELESKLSKGNYYV